MCRPAGERTQGEWNAYVVKAKTLGECKRRITEVPEQFRAHAESHARTVFDLRKQEKAK